MGGMRPVLAVLALCACGGAGHHATAMENRGGTASTSCDLPTRYDLEARRYGNVDANQADYQTWSPWRVGVQFRDPKNLRGTLAMVGDELVWSFDFTGTRADCTITLYAASHEPITVTIDTRTRTGKIQSIDDVWLLGPPFPDKRP